jgi:hypothetical protein
MQTTTDQQLHELARKRVEFRRHLIVFLVINTTLWLIWWLTGEGYLWPVWPLAGWGIGLIFHYLFEYRNTRMLSEEQEYLRLKKEISQKEEQA